MCAKFFLTVKKRRKVRKVSEIWAFYGTPSSYIFFIILKRLILYLVLIAVLIAKENLLGILVHSRLLQVLQHIPVCGLPLLFFSLSQNFTHNCFNFYVQEAYLTHFSYRCWFLNCSVERAVWMGGFARCHFRAQKNLDFQVPPPPPPLLPIG